MMASIMASLRDSVAACEGVAVLVEEGRGTDLIYLNLCKAFVAALHGILVSNLDRHGFDRGTTWWVWNCLDGHMQRVGSQQRPVTSDIAQGMALGPIASHLCWGHGQWDQGTFGQPRADTQLCGEVTS